MMTDKTTTASTSTDVSGIRLKKDGTPDRRGGKIGNKGNKHATGRKKLPGSEPRTNLLLYTSDTEFTVMKDFCRLLKDNPDTAKSVLAELGTPPPAGKKPPIRQRKSHGIRLTAAEKEIAKTMLSIVKDRITLARIALETATNGKK
jgi:hypothetical protein